MINHETGPSFRIVASNFVLIEMKFLLLLWSTIITNSLAYVVYHEPNDMSRSGTAKNNTLPNHSLMIPTGITMLVSIITAATASVSMPTATGTETKHLPCHQLPPYHKTQRTATNQIEYKTLRFWREDRYVCYFFLGLFSIDFGRVLLHLFLMMMMVRVRLKPSLQKLQKSCSTQ